MKPSVFVARSLVFVSFGALSLGAAMCSSPPDPAKPHAATATPPASPTLALAATGRDLHPFARPQFDVGRMAPETHLEGMSLLLQMTPGQKVQADALERDLESPLSPRYRDWITPAQYAASFGASRQTIARVTSWLEARGFTVHGAALTGTRIFFSGSVGQLEAAFQTEMHRYVINGQHHFALAVQPTYPAELAPSVLGLRGVHDFRLKPVIQAASKRAPSPDSILPYPYDGGTDQLLTLGPADFATIYNVTPLYDEHITGTGESIAIVGESEYNDADITAFRTTFGLDAANKPTRHFVSYSGNPIFSPDVFGEAELDLEWSGGIAKDASIQYVYTGDNPSYGAFDALLYAIEEGIAPIISASFAGCEYGQTLNETIFLETMGNAASMQGITVVNASGDWGAASCDAGLDQQETAAMYGPFVSWPSSVPSIVSVGGTEYDWGDPIPEAYVTPSVASKTPFSTYWGCTGTTALECSAKTYVPETGWNEMALEIQYNDYFWGASGGGPSLVFPKPYWQVGQTVAGGTRQVPDVSLSSAWAQIGYMLSTSWTVADGEAGAPYPETLYPSGGTSAATLSFAGILALVNESIAKASPTAPVGLGNANPMLYALNASTKGTVTPVFHDITSGSNIVPCQPGSTGCPASAPYQYGYSAGTGYDMVTGIGSVNAYNLATAWAALKPTATALTATPSGATEGSPVALTATVSSTLTTTSLTGTVSFYMKTTTGSGGTGVPDLTLVATAAVTPTTSGSDEGATASTTATVPPGRYGSASVVAFYGGDSHYLASWSTSSSVTANSTLAISPTGITLHPNEQRTFTTSGGFAPVQWLIDTDTTCDQYYDCSQIESLTATSGAFQAGPLDGATVIEAIDADGAIVRATITVSGAAVDGGVLPAPWDAGEDAAAAPVDASIEDGSSSAGEDGSSSTDAETITDAPITGALDTGAPGSGGTPDAQAPSGTDAGSATDAGSPIPAPASGCSCVVAGNDRSTSPGAAFAGALFAVAFAARRKRRSSSLPTSLRAWRGALIE